MGFILLVRPQNSPSLTMTYRNPVPTVDIIIELGVTELGMTELGMTEFGGMDQPDPSSSGFIQALSAPRHEVSIVLIERLNEPYGWALPGGFMDYGETAEAAAIREAQEETGLQVQLLEQFHVYSDPRRDPRQHTLSIVFIAQASGTPQAADDAKAVGIFGTSSLPALCFDHAQILADYYAYRHHGRRPGLAGARGLSG